MIDWSRIVGFDWGHGNVRKKVDKHHVNQAEAEQVFFNQPLLVVPDPAHSQHEARHHALGAADSFRLLHVTFTLRNHATLIRVISARDMHRKEKVIYGQSQENT